MKCSTHSPFIGICNADGVSVGICNAITSLLHLVRKRGGAAGDPNLLNIRIYNPF